MQGSITRESEQHRRRLEQHRADLLVRLGPDTLVSTFKSDGETVRIHVLDGAVHVIAWSGSACPTIYAAPLTCKASQMPKLIEALQMAHALAERPAQLN